MKRNLRYQEKKFISGNKEWQHRKLAEIIRACYEANLLDQKPLALSLLEHYHEILSWLGIPFEALILDHESLANAYHKHLKLAGDSLKEENFLPLVRKQDKSQPLRPVLEVDIFLDDLRSLKNIGSIVRTCEAFRLGSIKYLATKAKWEKPQLAKTAMGTEKWVSIEAIESLQALKRPILALETSDEALSIYDYPFPRSFTLIVGNEEFGISSEALNLADGIITIPLFGRKNSLNVANAFAVVAGEIVRQDIKAKNNEIS